VQFARLWTKPDLWQESSRHSVGIHWHRIHIYCQIVFPRKTHFSHFSHLGPKKALFHTCPLTAHPPNHCTGTAMLWGDQVSFYRPPPLGLFSVRKGYMKDSTNSHTIVALQHNGNHTTQECNRNQCNTRRKYMWSLIMPCDACDPMVWLCCISSHSSAPQQGGTGHLPWSTWAQTA
jgi:hypothetical protein